MNQERITELKESLIDKYKKRLADNGGDRLDGYLVVYRSIVGLINHNILTGKTDGLLGVLDSQLNGIEDVQERYKKMGIDTEDTHKMLEGVEEIKREIDKLM